MQQRGYYSDNQYCYRAIVKDVVNRSTVILDVDLGFHIFKYNQKYKLLKIDGYQYGSHPIDARYKVLRYIQPGDEVIIKSEEINSRMHCVIYTTGDPHQLYYYNAKMYKIVDGDTIDCELDLGMNTYYRERFRFYGIDAWETRGDERDRGLVAKARVIELAPVDSVLLLKTYRDVKGKYGRYLGDIFIPGNPKSINQTLLEEGHAIPYK